MGLFRRSRESAASETQPGRPQDTISASASGDDHDTYCRVETVTFPLGADDTLAYARDSRSAVVLSNFQARLQRNCLTFKSLRDHAIDLCRRFKLSERDVGAIEAHLASLVECGVLTSKKRVCEHCLTKAAAANDGRRISSVAVVTRNRVEAAIRCLGDLIANCKIHERSVSYVVFDDSPDAAVRRHYREVLRSVATRDGVQVLYAGTEEKERFVEALVDEGGRGSLPRQVADFALFGTDELTYRSGANRNACLLHTVGDAFLGVDDDTRGRIARAPEWEDGLSVASVADPTDFWFFPDRASARDAVEFIAEDPLAQHERLLGRDPATCVADLAGSAPLDLDRASSHLLMTLVSGKGRVRATMTGIVGDCAMGSRLYYLALRGAAHHRLVGDGPGYDVLRTTREVVRAASSWTISTGELFMTTAAGLDNTDLLPPFFPVQRNEDGVFSATLHSCSDEWLIGHLPWVIEHDPEESRTFGRSPSERLCRLLTPDVVIQCLASSAVGLRSHDPAERIRTLGRHLQSFGRSPAAEFEQFLRVERWRRLSAWISQLDETQAAHPDAPNAWQADVEQCIVAARGALLRDDVAPADLARDRTADQTLAMMQRLVYQFGELLEYWPDIWQAARNLKENGRTLSVPLR